MVYIINVGLDIIEHEPNEVGLSAPSNKSTSVEVKDWTLLSFSGFSQMLILLKSYEWQI